MKTTTSNYKKLEDDVDSGYKMMMMEMTMMMS